MTLTAHCREMLKLNPNDNQGIRHLLTGYYLELEIVDELALLLDDYSEDVRPYLQYTRALLAYRQSSPDADDIAKTAINSNRWGLKPNRTETYVKYIL